MRGEMILVREQEHIDFDHDIEIDDMFKSIFVMFKAFCVLLTQMTSHKKGFKKAFNPPNTFVAANFSLTSVENEICRPKKKNIKLR